MKYAEGPSLGYAITRQSISLLGRCQRYGTHGEIEIGEVNQHSEL